MQWEHFWESSVNLERKKKPSYVFRHVKGCATDLEKMAMKVQTAQSRWAVSTCPTSTCWLVWVISNLGWFCTGIELKTADSKLSLQKKTIKFWCSDFQPNVGTIKNAVPYIVPLYSKNLRWVSVTSDAGLNALIGRSSAPETSGSKVSSF